MPSLYLVSLFVAFSLGLLNFPLCCWFSFNTSQFILDLWDTPHDNSNTLASDRRGLRWTLGFTLGTSLSFVGSQMANLVFISDLIYQYATTDGDRHSLINEDSRSSNPGFLAVAAVLALGIMGGRVGLLIVLCERMRLTFESSQYAMSDCSVRSFRVIAGLEVMLNLLTMVLFAANKRSWMVTVMIIESLVYGSVSLALAGSFLIRAKQVSAPMMDASPSGEWSPGTGDPTNSGSQSDPRPALKASVPSDSVLGRPLSRNIQSRSSENTRHLRAVGLMDAALRIALLSIVGMMSTVIAKSFQIIYMAMREKRLEWIANSITMSDFVLNSFTLMCTFQRSSAYYRFAFGFLHDWVRDYLGVF